ncbi:unnamed protein product, partial [Mesorhabditis spiculigera]
MIRSLCLVAFVGNLLLIEAGIFQNRVKRQDVEAYCAKHTEHYTKFCNMRAADLDRDTFLKLAKFCPAYEKHCGGPSKVDPPAGLTEEMIVPPPLPRSGARLDLPLSGGRSNHASPSPADRTKLTAAIIASCTPDCSSPHCTTECKCANTHPKVHAMCNPPASAEMANTCQRWYAKCPMFQPVQYY